MMDYCEQRKISVLKYIPLSKKIRKIEKVY